jgi:hypothetical protein
MAISDGTNTAGLSVAGPKTSKQKREEKAASIAELCAPTLTHMIASRLTDTHADCARIYTLNLWARTSTASTPPD